MDALKSQKAFASKSYESYLYRTMNVNPFQFSIIFLNILFFLNVFPIAGKEINDQAEEDASKTTQEKIIEKDEIEKSEEEKPEEKEVAPPRIGNFSLPSSQQPAALYGFGGNIIDKGEVQTYFFTDDFLGKKRVISDLIPSILFGVTDDFTIYFNFPFTPEERYGKHRSSGLEDFFLQLEYAFYNKKTACYEDQATVVANIAVPTGSVIKNPSTGFGSVSYFIGGTYYRTFVDWVFFTNQGAILTTENRRIKIGDQFLYQFGCAKTVCSPRGYIYAAMLEVDGQYSQKNQMCGCFDPNSGGNFIYVTPSIWISSQHVLFQLGMSLPLTQHLFGRQRKINYGFNANFAWSFY